MSVLETYSGRSATGSQISRQYIASGYTTESAAIAAVHTALPSTLGDLERLDGETRVDELKENVYTATVTWRLVEPSVGLNYSFTLGGNSFSREFAIAQTGYWAGGVSFTATHVGINFDGERVNGVTLPSRPGLEFTIERLKPIADVDNAYIDAVSDLLFTTNDATFEGFPPGEVLFLGLTGSRQGDGDWRLYYKFGRNPNETGVTIVASEVSKNITGIDREGWQYLWVEYNAREDTTRKYLSVDPRFAYVAQVFEDGTFADLGL